VFFGGGWGVLGGCFRGLGGLLGTYTRPPLQRPRPLPPPPSPSPLNHSPPPTNLELLQCARHALHRLLEGGGAGHHLGQEGVVVAGGGEFGRFESTGV
jgi:hypothetical protein